MALRAGRGLARRFLATASSSCLTASASEVLASVGSLAGGIENSMRRMNACSAAWLAGSLSGRGGGPEALADIPTKNG